MSHCHGLPSPIQASATIVEEAIAGRVSLMSDEFNQQSVRVSCAELSTVTFLGTSSAQPLLGMRNMSSLVVSTALGSCIMIDCGEGTQHQVMCSKDVKMSKISAILITHLHGDHCYGLFGLLCTLALNGRSAPLPLVGPAGLQAMVNCVLGLSSGVGEEPLSYALIFHELDATRAHDFALDVYHGHDAAERLLIHATPLKHGMPTLGYVISELARARKLDAAKAMTLGAKGHALGQLKQGLDVVLPDGTSIRAQDVLHAPIRRAVCVLQDTAESLEAERYLNSSSFPSELSVLIHECTYDAALEELARQRFHSTSKMAGEFAARVRAKTLVLTHFSTRYEPPGEQDQVVFSLMDSACACSASDAGRGGSEHVTHTLTSLAAPSPESHASPAASTQRKVASALGLEALAAAHLLSAEGCGGVGDDFCVVCAEDFMTLGGNNFRQVLRSRSRKA